MADIAVGFDRQKDGSWQGYINGERVKGEIGFNWERSSQWVKTRLSTVDLERSRGRANRHRYCSESR